MTTRYTKHADIRLTELEGEGIVLHLGSRRYFSVSETGLAVLRALEGGPRSSDELVEALVDEYEISKDLARPSVRGFVEKCLEAKLLSRTDD